MSLGPKVTIKDLLYSYDDPSVTFIKFCFSYSSVMITLNSIFVQSLCPLCANMIHLVSSPVAWPKWLVTPLVPVIPARKIIHLIKLVDYLLVQADKPWCYFQWAFGANMTLCYRRCDVITSHRR